MRRNKRHFPSMMQIPHLPIKWNWSWAFSLFIALPALALALLGMRAVRAESIEQEQKLREQERQIARLAEKGLETNLLALEANWNPLQNESRREVIGSGVYPFSLQSNGLLKFYQQHVYFGDHDPPQWSPIVEDLIDTAQAAKAQRRNTDAIAAYRRVSQIEPRLSEWANVGIAAAQQDAGASVTAVAWASNELATSDSITPTGLPVALIACAYLEPKITEEPTKITPFLQATLEQLRGGRWWLSYDERRFYDDRLRQILNGAGLNWPEDDELKQLGAIERIVRITSPPSRDGFPSFEPAQTKGFLISWSKGDEGDTGRDGFVLSEDRLTELFNSVLSPLLSGQSFSAEVRDINGRPVWSNLQGKAATTEPLRTVRGLEIVFSGLRGPSWLGQKQLMWLAFIVLLVAMMIAGLTMTARVVRREVELGRLQNEFIAAVSHEFKSPIASIRLLVERMTSGKVRESSTMSNYCDAIDRESERLERLVNRLLEWQQIQSGRKRYDFVPASPVEATKNAIEQMRPQADAKEIVFSTNFQRSPQINLDDAAFTDAVENLIDNAIKYSAASTTISVSCTSVDHSVCIEVRDEGLGIAEDELPHIFDRFYRGRRGDMTNVRGTGLGLALVKATVEAHGGRIEVTSKPGVGSCFRLWLPNGSGDGLDGANSNR